MDIQPNTMQLTHKDLFVIFAWFEKIVELKGADNITNDEQTFIGKVILSNKDLFEYARMMNITRGISYLYEWANELPQSVKDSILASE
jgi:hypothetical protein